MDLINKYFNNFSDKQLQQLSALESLYADWNSKINVISRKDIDNFYEHHVLHSLSIAKVIDFKPGTKILDAGTGGGFPGVPLAIAFPECDFLLADSIGKKLKVIEDVCQTLGIDNVRTKHVRVEDLDEEFDFVVSRAVTRLDEMWNWTHRLIKKDGFNDIKNGLIYLKGGDIADEVPNKISVQKTYINELFLEPYFEEKAIVTISDS